MAGKGIHYLGADEIANQGMQQIGYDLVSRYIGSATWNNGDAYWNSVKAIGGNVAVTSGTNILVRVHQVHNPGTYIQIVMFPGDVVYGPFNFILAGPISVISTPPAIQLMVSRGGGNHG